MKNWKDGNFLGVYPASTKVKHKPINPKAHAQFVERLKALPPEKR